MGNYGNNIVAYSSMGDLIYVDETAGVDIAETEFDRRQVAVRDTFLDFWGLDGIYQPGSLNRAIKYIPKFVEDANLSQGVSRLKSPLNTIKVPNTATLGITAAEFVSGQTVSIAPRKGADARVFKLTRIVPGKQSAAWVTYEVK
jgi:hypothetical protein